MNPDNNNNDNNDRDNQEPEESERRPSQASSPKPPAPRRSVYVTSAAGVAVILCVLLAVYLLTRGGDSKDHATPVAGQSSGQGQTETAGVSLGTSILKIYFPLRTEFLAEDHPVPRTTKPHETALAALKEFFKGPASKKEEALIPKGVEVLGVYMSTDGTLYIDLSSQMTGNFQGDALGEHLFLKALYETLRVNVGALPGGIRVLVEGAEVDSLGGHVSMRRGLEEAVGSTTAAPTTEP